MGKKVSAARFPAPHNPINTSEFTVYNAEDSMSIVMVALYNPILPAAPLVERMFLLCSTRRVTIMTVRRTLSETEIERYGRPKSRVVVIEKRLHSKPSETSSMIPIATFVP